jgi:hypothetical protein
MNAPSARQSENGTAIGGLAACRATRRTGAVTVDAPMAPTAVQKTSTPLSQWQ